MKRCPECLFIYPETDTRCDFDSTALVVVDDAEIESATSQAPAAATTKKKRASASKKRATGAKKKKGTAITAAVGLVVGLVGFFVYLGFSQRADNVADIPPAASVSKAITPPQAAIVSPSPVESAAPASPEPVAKAPADRTATSHSRTTAAPVSTSGPGIGKKLGGKPVILLSSGGRIEADEVWRTRDGVWYRRAGIVTLLKHNRVKAITNQ
jgi:hypothetical protein